ncbi:MAG: outer membrane lipoprotein-sorting protein [Pseudomonadota bacterium]
MKLTFILTASLLGVMWTQRPARAADDARAFMAQVLEKNSFKDMQGDVVLTLRSPSGDTKVREIQMWSRTNASDENSMLMRFVKPADVRGTGFLTIEHKGSDDDRRLFLPALRRVNRISASGSGGNFMSSDFTYYDVGMPKLADWSYTFSGDDTRAGVACKLVSGTPATPKVLADTGYTKVVWCVDPARKLVIGADYYEKGERKLKVLEVLKVEDVQGTPFATHMRVQDSNTGHQSEMEFKNLKTDTGIADTVFTERNLKKWTR